MRFLRTGALVSLLITLALLDGQVVSHEVSAAHNSRCRKGTSGDGIVGNGSVMELTMPSSVYYDKALGSWMGQMIGNILGLPTEGKFIEEPNPEYVTYYPNVPTGAFTDDDTSMEWVFLHMLEEHGLELTYTQVREEWMEHINDAIWVANARARKLMDEGYVPPDTGSKKLNEHWGAIDAQIECELFGVINPGMGQRAYEMARWFARVTNDDYAVEAAAFYAVMFSYAFFESDVPAIVNMALTKIPRSSLTWEVVSDVIRWHGEFPDWRDTRGKIWEKYGRYGWLSSPLNLASVVMALLYGNGDFDLSVMIAVAAGWDNDCNAATTAGLLGLIVGESGIHDRWKAPLMDTYKNTNRDNLPDEKISNIALRTQAVAETAILAYGGAVLENGNDRTYVIRADLPWVEKPSNRLSDYNLARMRSSAAICYDGLCTPDFIESLKILNDGVVRDRRRLALRGRDVGEEYWWGYAFGDTFSFNQVVYYQTDVPTGGGWWDMPTVQYRDKTGRWRNVTGLTISSTYELTDNGLLPYVRHLLSFDAVNGTGIRVFGNPEHHEERTSLSELEVFYRTGDSVAPPSPPTGLRATLIGGNAVLLEWSDASSNERAFVVKRRRVTDREYREIATLAAGVTSYMDEETEPLTVYSYVVEGVNEAGVSGHSKEAIVFTLLPSRAEVYVAFVAMAVMLTAAVVLTRTRKLGAKFPKEDV
jgi:ADP-ribosylglycohydrolase